MRRMIRSIAVVLLVAAVSAVPGARSGVDGEEHEEFWKMVRTVQNVLEGKDLEQAQQVISPGADLVCGTRLQNLGDVLSGRDSSCSLVDTSYHAVAVQGRTNTSEDMGFIVLKTVQSDTTKVRYHSVVFLKDSVGHYKIIHWHGGSQRR